MPNRCAPSSSDTAVGATPNVTGSPISAIARAPSRRTGASGPGPPVPSQRSSASVEPTPHNAVSAASVASTAALSRYGTTPSQTTKVGLPRVKPAASSRSVNVWARKSISTRMIEPEPNSGRARRDDRGLAPGQRRQVDLVHRPTAQLGREPVGPAVVAGAEDEHLLGSLVERAEQVLVDEAVPAQHVGRQPAEIVLRGKVAQWGRQCEWTERGAHAGGQEQRRVRVADDALRHRTAQLERTVERHRLRGRARAVGIVQLAGEQPAQRGQRPARRRCALRWTAIHSVIVSGVSGSSIRVATT